MINVRFARVHPDAERPEYMSEGAACFDVRARLDKCVTIAPGESVVIPTGLIFEVPQGWRLDLYSRSGLWFKHRVRLGNGVGKIDSDFRGELMISLENAGKEPYTVLPRERIAQGELNRVMPALFIECHPAEVSDTKRGDGGFGSTGKH